MKRIIFISIIALTLITAKAYVQDQNYFSDIDSYKGTLDLEIKEEKQIDIDNDGLEDYLIYSSAGKDLFLGILINKETYYNLLNVPVCEKYDVEKSSDKYILKTGQGTYKRYGTIQGADKYLWYDFYIIVNDKLENINYEYIKFYKDTLKLYKKRINELEKEIKDIRKVYKDKRMEYFIKIKNDHIAEYKDFILKIQKLIKENK